eukprot:Skav204994  [mRNA]  locus=scaffold4368:37075:42904:+ [translate_table: standard]
MGMSFSVPEALVPAAPEGALMERFAEEASLQTPMDPLQRLDQSMEQTSDWVRLREILERSSPFVRNTICNALQYEMARSFQNVAQQLQAVQDIVAEMQRIMDSEEAVALGHLMRDIHPSNIRALQREADGIEEDITALRSALERGDFQSLQLRASRVGNKVRRFRDKYAELRPKLERLKSAVEKIADMCAAEARQSEDLITETEQKKESWWRLLENATNVAASAVTAAQTTVTSIQAAQAALWTSSRACFLYAGSLLLALALLGYVGRDLVKKLLGQLWAAEIEEHKRSKDAFQHMEQVVRLAAAKLGPVCAKNEALENCLDLVVEAAEELTAGAEDALVSTSHDMEHDRLHTLVEHLSSVYAQVPAAFAELSSSLRDLEPSLQHVGQIALHPAAAFDDRGESRLALSYAGHDADPTQGQSLDIEVDPHPQPENHLPENVFNMEVFGCSPPTCDGSKVAQATLVRWKHVAAIGMSIAVAEALVPAAPVGTLMEPFAEEASLQPAVPMDPLQRLEQSMEQTSDWVRLREILERSSLLVRERICSALHYGMAQSFQNVTQHLQAVQDIVAEIQRMVGSQEAADLGQLMHNIHPSNSHAVQREADGINKHTTKLRSAVQSDGFEGLQSRARLIAKKAKRFRDRYEHFRPKLGKLKREADKIADNCAPEMYDDLWWRYVEQVVQLAAQRLGSVFHEGNNLQEIKDHNQTKAAFQHVEEVVRLAAEKLGSVCEKNSALEDCLDKVVEAAERLAATAEDAAEAPEEKEAARLVLRKQVEELCSKYSECPKAFDELFSSFSYLRDLEPVLQRVRPVALHPVMTKVRELRLAWSFTDGDDADPMLRESF